MEIHKIRVSIKGFFFNRQNEVLLIEGQDSTVGGKYWAAPGGGVEDGESLTAALERELVEETGYFGRAEKIVFAQDYFNKHQGRQLEIFFIGRIDDMKKPLEEHDHPFKFFSKTEFQKIVFLPKIDPFALRSHSGIEYQTYLKGVSIRGA